MARAVFRVAVSGRREQEASFFAVVVRRDQAEHAAESLAKGGLVWSWAVPAAELDRRERQRRSVVEVVAEELGPSLPGATARRSGRPSGPATSAICER